MFKIKVQKLSFYTNQNDEKYSIRYELTPDISNGIENSKIHQSLFSNQSKALKVADSLSLYLVDSYFFLDLVYNKLRSLELSDKILPKYLQINFNSIELARVNLYQAANKRLEAYQHIENFKSFISVLKYWCFAISKEFDTLANRLFSMLLDFEQSFINCYRSAKLLSANNQLKMFL